MSCHVMWILNDPRPSKKSTEGQICRRVQPGPWFDLGTPWCWLILVDIDWYWLILIDIDWYWSRAIAIECHQKRVIWYDLMQDMPEFSDRGGSWRLQGFSKDYWRLSLCVLGRLQNSSRTVGVAVRSSEYWKYLEINELINNFHELCIQYIIFNCVCKSLTLMILMFSRSCLKRYENFNLKYFWACFGHVLGMLAGWWNPFCWGLGVWRRTGRCWPVWLWPKLEAVAACRSMS